MKKTINRLFTVAVIMGSIMLFGGCKELSNYDNGFMLLDVVISGPGVSNHAAMVEMESTLQLSAQEKYDGMTDMIWKSEDESIAKVDYKTGLVTPVAPGTVKITAYTDTKDVRQGDYIMITVVGKSLSVINDALDQSQAE